MGILKPRSQITLLLALCALHAETAHAQVQRVHRPRYELVEIPSLHPAGYAYAGYGQLKAVGVVDTLAALLHGIDGVPGPHDPEALEESPDARCRAGAAGRELRDIRNPTGEIQ